MVQCELEMRQFRQGNKTLLLKATFKKKSNLNETSCFLNLKLHNCYHHYVTELVNMFAHILFSELLNYTQWKHQFLV